VGGEDQRAVLAHGELHAAAAATDGAPDGRGPPGLHEAEPFGDGHGGQAGQRELDRQPPGAGDALVPGQVVRPGLELTGDQRRSPEDADDGGGDQDDHDADQVHQPVAAGAQLLEEGAGQIRATAAALQPATPLAEYSLARCGPVTASRTANPASAAAAVTAWMRN
jgi:hypothetical protein